MEFGENLKKAREEKGMTQQTLADQLYVTRQAVSRWECGARYPDLMTTKCISAILGISIDALVSEDEMQNFSEKRSLLDGQKTAKVMTSIYSATALFCLIHMFSSVAKYIWVLQDGINSLGTMLPILVLTEVMYLIIFVISGSCMMKSLKQDIDARFAGIVGMVFFGVKAIYDFGVVFITTKQLTGNLLIPLLELGLVVLIGCFFLGKKNGLAKPLYVGCSVAVLYQFAVVFYELISFFRNGQWEYFSLTYLQGILGVFTELAITSLMIAQAVILEKNRKRQKKMLATLQ